MNEQFRSSLAGRLVGVILFGLGLLALLGSWGGHWFDLEIQDRGGRAVGHVTGKHFAQPSDWTLDYWFLLPGGQRLEVRHRGISEPLWRRLQVGDVIDVRYELNKPSRNFPVYQGNTPLAPVLLASVIGLAFAIAGVFLFVGSFRNRVSDGQPGA